MRIPTNCASLLALAVSAVTLHAAEKTLIDYFLPMPIGSSLVTNVWGAPGVFPRDPQNGLEDTTMKQWCYWDGQIMKAADGKYHMFASRWDQAKGHDGWWGSLAVHAVSDNVIGPYLDKGLCWPDDHGGKGHNVTALTLPDGRFAVVVSETRPGDVFVSKSLDGPWEHLGAIQVATNQFSRAAQMSNVAVLARPDGKFMIVARSGAIWMSQDGILGPYVVQGPSVYPSVAGLSLENLEDPAVWFSGGLYHIVVNSWSNRKAYHITSADGINDWTLRGLAYDPTTDFVRYTNGIVNHWEKIERPGVLLEGGHVTHFTFAVLDVPKDQERGNDSHGSKVIVVPFDGVSFDRDMAKLAASSKQAAERPNQDHIDGFRDTPIIPGTKWHLHDPDRPQPPVVTPGAAFSQGAQPPSDAEILFDGKDLAQWQNNRGQPATWKVQDGYVETAARGGGIRSRGKWADVQLHVEWAAPNPPRGSGQGRGNSGILFNGMYEVQVLDSYQAKSYPDGQAGAIYGQSPPLVNASKPPGEWQTYDIIFESPRWDDGGQLVKQACVTVIHNGVVIQNHYEFTGSTDGISREVPWKTLAKYVGPHPPEVFVELQDHNNPVRYRNIWVRQLGVRRLTE